MRKPEEVMEDFGSKVITSREEAEAYLTEINGYLVKALEKASDYGIGEHAELFASIGWIVSDGLDATRTAGELLSILIGKIRVQRGETGDN